MGENPKLYNTEEVGRLVSQLQKSNDKLKQEERPPESPPEELEKYSHSQIAEICRNELLDLLNKWYDIGRIIHDFGAERDGKKTTLQVLRSEIRKKFEEIPGLGSKEK